MLIKTATLADIPQLRKLWNMTFPDDTQFIDPFLDARFPASEVLYIPGDQQIASAIYLVNCSYTQPRCNDHIPLRLLVGAATADSYRRMGMMAALLHQACESSATPIVLYPAVRSYYQRNGFQSSSRMHSYTLEATAGSQPPTCQTMLDMELMDTTYTRSVQAHGALVRDAFAWLNIVPDDGWATTLPCGAYAFGMGDTALECAGTDASSSRHLLQWAHEHGVRHLQTIIGSPLDTYLQSLDTPCSDVLAGMSHGTLPPMMYIGEQY